MSNVVFLLVALVLSALGTAALVWRHRQPTRVEHGIHAFQREMRALTPHRHRPDGDGPRRTRDGVE